MYGSSQNIVYGENSYTPSKTFLTGILGILSLGIKILFFSVFLLALFFFLSAKFGSIGGYQALAVLTGSMEPTFPVGSLILVEKQWPYKTGDAIAFRNKGNVNVTHRIIEKLSQNQHMFYRVKGDANKLPDTELVAENQVQGKATLAIPYIGRLSQFLKSPYGFLGFIIAPSILYVALELWNIKKELEIQIREKVLAQLQTNPNTVPVQT